jgi:MarR family transcriptional regulator, organic hydroperoxide resistance regulator
MEVLMDSSSLTADVGFLLSRASGQLIRATNTALAVHGLRVRSYSALLLACDSGDGMSQRDLAEALGLDPSQVVLLVDELTESGLVERHPSESDRRTKLVRATGAGQVLRRHAERSVGAAHRVQLDGLSAGEQEQLRGLLARLVRSGQSAPLP